MDFWARGAYHRAKKIIKGPKKKKGTRLTVGMDGVRRKRKKMAKLRKSRPESWNVSVANENH